MKVLLSIYILLMAILSVSLTLSVSGLDCSVTQRQDCGYLGIDQKQCQNKGCCWVPAEDGSNDTPWCFYPITTKPTWSVTQVLPQSGGFAASIALDNPGAGSYGPALSQLKLIASFETELRVHFKLVDPSNARYEVPTELLPYPSLGSEHMPLAGEAHSFDFGNPLYFVNMSRRGEAFTLRVIRSIDKVTIFDLADLEYSDMFLQLSNVFPQQSATTGPFIYGLGEREMTFQLPTDDHSFTMWNVDEPTPYDQNEYGTHPFYLQTLPDSGHAHGMFLRNSNGQDIIVAKDRVTFRAIGGILDWYIFVGPTHEQVIQQYHGLIGKPHFTPYWSLGWHQCKYGWKNLDEVKTVVSTYAQHKIPLDTVWADIDYMDQYEDFSFDPVNYPPDQVAAFVKELHSNGQHYVVIVDPGIHNRSGYKSYEQGLQADIFIKNGDGKTPFIGRVWPGYTAFPDFLNPNTKDYWKEQIDGFLQMVPVDGLWTDMNEISNFDAGQAYNPDAPVNNPPYAINNFNSRAPLNTKALPPDALHYGPNGKTYLEYDVHNLYGLSESIATHEALESLKGTRSFTLTRSSFPGSGAHTAMWLGDNHATWDSMKGSIAGIMNANMFGIPMVGVDICGFLQPTTEELCARWTAVGAFYPFARNHHEPSSNQEPYLWPSVEAVAKKVLAMRYSLLPTFYTEMERVHSSGGTAVRSLMFNFPTDPNTYSIDQQFMWGTKILVTPVLTQGANTVEGYFPPASVWYNLWNMTRLPVSEGGYLTFPCAIEDGVVLHLAGGSIIVQQAPELTTTATRLNPFSLTVGLAGDSTAAGSLFWDDGEQLVDGANSLSVSFAANGDGLTSQIVANTFTGAVPNLESVTVGGFHFQPSTVTVNGQSSTFHYDATSQVLTIDGFSVSMTQPMTIHWANSSRRHSKRHKNQDGIALE